MLSHLLPVKILPQQNETYRVPFSFEGQNIFTREGETSSYYLNANGVETANNSYCISDYIEVEPLKRYIIACQTVLTASRYHCWYNSSKAFIESDHWGQESFIAPQNAKYVRLSYRTTFPATDMHIEVGTITTGVLDLKTGVLTTDYGYISDLSKYTTQIQNASYANLYRTIVISGAYNTASSERNQFIRCSHYQPSTGTSVNNSMPNGSCLMVGGSSETARGYFTFRNNNYDNDLAGWQTTLPGIQVWYRLRNTLTYQLTPADIKLLQGYNNITSNATELQFTYLNDKNETIALSGDDEYTIDDGVFNRSPSIVNQIFEPKQDLHGYDYPWPPGGGGNLMNIGDIELLKDTDLVHINSTRTGFYGTDEDLVEMFNGDEWGYIPILGQDILNPVGIEYDTPYTLYFRAYTDAEESTSGTGLAVTFYDEGGTKISSISLRNNYTSEREFSYTTFDPDRGEPGYTLGGIAIVGGSGLCGNTWHFEFMTLAEGTSYIPYSNICPIEGHTDSILTVEGTPISDSESERRLKTITRPVFQWDVGLKLKFEGYTFADGTLCQFDNKLTTFSQNEYIVNNECTIPASLLDENCQGDIVAHINVSGNDYDVVVYEVYIPVIKRAKPENFLRPAIDLPQAVVASFADGADGVPLEKLNLPLLPKQDLHGYDYPWVGGGGKNKIDDSLKYQSSATASTGYIGSTSNNYAVPLSAGTYTISVDFNGVPYSMYMREQNDTENTMLWSAGALTQKTFTVSGGMYRFWIYRSSGVDVNDIKTVQIEVGSTATVYAPYSNICPITGHTSASVVRAGRNLWPHGDLSGTGNSGGRDFNPNLPAVNTKYTVSGVFTSSDTDATTNNFAIQFTGGSNYLQMTRGARSSKSSTRTNEAIRQARLYASSSSAQSAGDTFTGTDIQFEIGTSASSYEPYKGEVFTIPFIHEGPNVFTTEGATLDRYINSNGQEASSTNYRITAYIPVEPNKRYVYDANTARFSTSVYHAYFDANKQLITSVHAMQEGFYIPSNIYYVRLSYRKDEVPTDFHISIGTVPHGTLDIKSGILTQDYAFVSDMANMHWRLNSASYPGIFRTDYYLGNIYGPTTASGRIRGFSCSCYKPMEEDHAGSGSNSTPYAMMRYNGALFIRNDDFASDATSFKASLAGQQVVYELDRESPAIYQLTPTEVKTLLGYNNIWADTGEVEVSYYPDPYLHFET